MTGYENRINLNNININSNCVYIDFTRSSSSFSGTYMYYIYIYISYLDMRLFDTYNMRINTASIKWCTHAPTERKLIEG